MIYVYIHTHARVNQKINKHTDRLSRRPVANGNLTTTSPLLFLLLSRPFSPPQVLVPPVDPGSKTVCFGLKRTIETEKMIKVLEPEKNLGVTE